MIGRLFKDESGMTMGLVVIMIVLIGVMGAGLLTFVSTDLNSVVEVNQGQKALEVADAGIEAAKQQLISDNAPRIHYDGGADDLPWSYCYGFPASGCNSATPASEGSDGMAVDVDGNTANVTIVSVVYSPGTYRVISEGQVGDARRKIEAIFRHDAAVKIPPTYFTRGNLTLTGAARPRGISFFALGNAVVDGAVTWGTTNDLYYGKWAETSGAGPYPNGLGSYPNAYNATARASALPGIGATGTITGMTKGTRSYDSTTTPKMVSDFGADGTPGQQSTEISFPFEVPTPAEDKEEINLLRQRALALEQASPGTPYYIDSIPGNGVDDPGLANGARTINPWPSGSTYETVVFYKYAAYNSTNRVSYEAGPSGTAIACATPGDNKGVIVVENGDMVFAGNKRFDGGIIVRAYDTSGNLLPSSGGLFDGSGTPCLQGYVNTSGNMQVTGTIAPGAAPELGGLASFRGSMEQISWRELYQ